MNINLRIRVFLAVLTAGASVLLAGAGSALSFTTVYHFPAASGQNLGGYSTNHTGAHPQAGLIVAGNQLYGTAGSGGPWGWGTVFALHTDGTGFTVLHAFTDVSRNSSGYFTNSDGIQPAGSLVVSGNTLYGTTQHGGSWGFGKVFALHTDGSGFTTLHHFAGGSGGANPQAGLILSGRTLYGTTLGEASLGAAGSDFGTVFALQTDGTGFTNLHAFTAPHPITGINEDGAAPYGGLVLSSNVLYGMACRGGRGSIGTVFAVHTDGTGFATLHDFTPGNGDGSSPRSGLTLSGNTLYGTTGAGGAAGAGTVFKLNTDGSGFAILHEFATFSWTPEGISNSDGYSPSTTLWLAGQMLYGTASTGGHSGRGTVFAVNTDGTGFTNWHTFTALSDYFPTGVSSNLDGAHPGGSLVAAGCTLYGAASGGGSAGRGTLFSLSFPPQLKTTAAGANVIVTWPTQYAGFDYAGFALQSATNLVSPVWATDSAAPCVVNGQNIATNLSSSRQQFYRLRH